LGVVATNAVGKAGSPHPPASAHSYALPHADYLGRQSLSSQQVQTLSRTSSTGALATAEAQFESGQGFDHSLSNGPTVERSPRRRHYGARMQQPVVSGGSSGNNATKLMGSSAIVASPPVNLPLDHGSYHSSNFMPPPVAVVSAPSISSAGTPVASTAPSVVLANGSISQELSSSCPEAAMTAQCNGQRTYRDQTASINSSSPSSSNIVEFSHPLPTPSPSPNARFLNITDAGGILAPKFEDIHVKAPISSVVERLTPTTVGKNRKSSDE